MYGHFCLNSEDLPMSCSEARSRGRCLGWPLLVMLATGCASVANRGTDMPPSSALTNVRETRLGRHFLNLSDAHAGKSGYHLLDAGIEGLATRVQIIRHAERTLDLQYFIFRGDETGSLIREELRHAADRGVRIRVLVDEGRLDYRMHNKLLVADNAIALVGGRNVGNQYFQVDPDSQFADDEVCVAGPMSQTLSKEFDEFWNGDMVVPAQALGGLPAYRKPASIPVVRGGDIDYVARIDSDEPYRASFPARSSLPGLQQDLSVTVPTRDTSSGARREAV